MSFEPLSRAAVFALPGELLQAMLLVRRPPAPLPDRVFRIPAADTSVAGEQGTRRWAIRVTEFGGEKVLGDLVRQHGWRTIFRSDVSAEPVSTLQLLQGNWHLVDPLRLMSRRSYGFDARAERAEWTEMDAPQPWLRFILAAANQEVAKKVLDDLCRHQIPGVRARPVLPPQPDAAGQLPFEFFWSVLLDRHDPFVLRSASRVWWQLGTESLHGAPTNIHVQYPFALDVDPAFLASMPWPAGCGEILLGPDDPQLLCLDRQADGQTFSDYLGAVSLSVDSPLVSVPVVARTAARHDIFTVQIRSAHFDAQQSQRQRAQALRHEIHAKTQYAEWLEAQLPDHEESEFIAEPLFLIEQANPDEVPWALQCLFIEWSDQPEELEDLRHARIRVESLSGNGLNPELHVVTCSTALGDAGQPLSRSRLVDFASRVTVNVDLGLDPMWARHGLRLFTPMKQHVGLYPNLRPSKLAAEMLLTALHGNRKEHGQDWLHILVPLPTGGFHFLLLRKEDMQPLSKAFDWHLHVDASASRAHVMRVHDRKQRIQDEAHAHVAAATEVLYRELREHVMRRVDALQKRAGVLAKASQEREGQLRGIEEDTNRVLALLDQARNMRDEALRLAGDLAVSLKVMHGGVLAPTDLLERLTRSLVQQQELLRKLQVAQAAARASQASRRQRP